jgi:hypothetical protein
MRNLIAKNAHFVVAIEMKKGTNTTTKKKKKIDR